ncbi:peptidylprolyl isomerase [Pelotomaculum propionicicum]|uniref:peptidylprolyl isomerase n=1 Tax=Pelotomaculum propionicicum TaxID=258475 RepID=A0A4Y7RU24_9FIRM|nr:peptidylprolyl isomerase [Pelotomaculum propionicicum]TEB12256.1 Foldase protein PrsA 3 [Pelotomaculum propionicicum]
MKYKIIVLLTALLVLTAIAAAGCGKEVVATVNGEKITREDLTKQVDELKKSYEQQGIDFSGDNAQNMLQSLEKDTLDQMIDTKLLLQEAKKKGKLTKDQVQERVKPLKEQFPSEEEYQKFLTQVNLKEEDVACILFLQEEVTKDVAPASDEELKKFYDDYKEQFSEPEQYQVRHILFFIDDGTKGYPAQHTDEEARKLAEDVITQLDQGKDFAELASQKSEDSTTKSNGGLYTFAKGETVQEFSDAATALNEGEYTTEPVKTDYGYHVIKLEKIIPASQKPFDEVKQQIADHLSGQAKQDKFDQFIKEAKEKATIVNNLKQQ